MSDGMVVIELDSITDVRLLDILKALCPIIILIIMIYNYDDINTNRYDGIWYRN